MAELKHLDAFEYYYSLGSARTYEQVAQKVNKSVKTVGIWGSKEKWQEEVRLRDLEAVKESRRQSLINRRSKATEYKKIVEASLDDYVKRLKKGNIEVKSVKDVDVLMRLMCFLDGYALDGEDMIIGETVQDQSAGDAKEQQTININSTFSIKR